MPSCPEGGHVRIEPEQPSTNLTPIGFPGLSDIGDGSFVPLQDIDNTFQYLEQ